MNRFFYLSLFLLVSLGFICPGALKGQVIADPEAEYQRIRSLALSGNYSEAVSDARRLVNEFPSYGDARILLGRIHAWQEEYDVAEAIIDTLLMTEPENEDALSALKDIKRWSRNENESKALPDTDIRTSYLFDTFSKPPYNRFWQVARLGAGHHFSWGLATVGVNVGNVILGEPADINETEWQLETEAWPKLTKHNYAFISYAYSPGIYFPKHRAALEIWETLPAGWALSAGVNYYYFNSNIFIASLSAEKYLGNYWLAAKGYFYFKDIGITTSLYLNARRYFNKNDYIQVTLGTGTAPDEPFNIASDLERLGSKSIRLSYFDQISQRWSLRIGAGYSYEEYAEGSYHNRFEGVAGLIYVIRMKQ